MTFYTTTVYTSCDCPHQEDSHYLIRCGCPNDRGPDHPMYQMEDGFHRIWCSDCMRYCSQPPACPGVDSAKTATPIVLLLRRLKGFGRSLVTFMFTTLGQLTGPAVPSKLWHPHS